MKKIAAMLLCILPVYVNAQSFWSTVHDDEEHNKSHVTDKALFQDSVILVSGFVSDASCRFHNLFAFNLKGEKRWNIPSVCDVIATDSNFIYTAGFDIGTDDVGNDEQLVVSKYDKDGAEIFSLRLSSSNLIDRYIDHGGNYYPTGINISEDGTILVSFDKSICKSDIAGTKIQEFIVTLPDIEGIISLSPVSYLIYTQNQIYKSDSAFVVSDSISFSGSINKMLLKNDTLFVLSESGLARLDTNLVVIDTLMVTNTGFRDMEFFYDQLWIRINDPDSVKLLKVTGKNTADTLSFELLSHVKGFTVSQNNYTFIGDSYTDQIGLYNYEVKNQTAVSSNLTDIELVDFTIDSIVPRWVVRLPGDSIVIGFQFNTELTIRNNGPDTVFTLAVYSDLRGGFNCARNFYYQKFTDLEIPPGQSETFQLRRAYEERYNYDQMCFQCLAPNSKLEQQAGNNSLCIPYPVLSIKVRTWPEAKVYPNPFSDHIVVENSGLKKIIIDLTDSYGKRVLTRTTTDQRIRIETGSLTPGPYVLKVTSGGRVSSYVVMKD